MSLAKTLLKVAIGVAIAKGVSSLTKSSGSARAETPSGTTKGRGTAMTAVAATCPAVLTT